MKWLLALMMVCMLGSAEAQPIGAYMLPVYQWTLLGNPYGNPARYTLTDPGYPGVSHQVLCSLYQSPSLVLFGRQLGVGLDAMTYTSLILTNSAFLKNFSGTTDANAQAKIEIWTHSSATFLKGVIIFIVGITWDPARTNPLHVSNTVTMHVL